MKDIRICVIGLGYVGLPLARLFSTRFPTIGFDRSTERVAELMQGRDHTLEISEDLLQEALQNGFRCTADLEEIRGCNFYIVCVPTPVDAGNQPDFRPLIGASETVGKVIGKGDVVVYESTVYPGATEEICIPVVEKASGLKFNTDFFAGYSPERINPGDKKHTVEKIKKVTSGSTPEAAQTVDAVYAAVIAAGTHLAPSIRVAEAAKVIENSQRDINIAFVNELAKIFSRMGLNTHAVLEAAGTKWNFLPFRPGLVGGHCIGVDPYYLAQCAERYGYHPEIILSGRRLNNSMGDFIAGEVIKLMTRKGMRILGARILVLGLTFKENCPDVRNTRVVDILCALDAFGAQTVIHDPWADVEAAKEEYGVDILPEMPEEKFDAIILAVAHDRFADVDLRTLLKEDGVIYDVKSCLPPGVADAAL